MNHTGCDAGKQSGKENPKSPYKVRSMDAVREMRRIMIELNKTNKI